MLNCQTNHSCLINCPLENIFMTLKISRNTKNRENLVPDDDDEFQIGQIQRTIL